MRRVVQCVISFLFLLGTARAQQIGSVDLSRAVPFFRYSEDLGKTNGCSSFSPGMIADGIVGLGQQPREITVKLVSVTNEKPTEGSILQGEVELRNTGTEPIEIPWSTDPSVMMRGQGPNRFNWEVATFRILFNSGQDNDSGVLLKSLTTSLYGSQFSAGSMLTVQPGQWVTAAVRFKLEAMYLYVPGEFKDGPAKLSAKWEQTARAMSVKDCVVSNSYAQYDNFYNQQKLSLLIDVKGAGSPTDNGRPPVGQKH